MQFKKTFRQSELIDRLKAARVSSPTGQVGFHAVPFDFITSVLESGIDFTTEIPEADRRGLIHRGVKEASKQARFDLDLFEKQMALCENEYLSLPPRDYVLACSLRITNYKGVRRTSLGNATISFHRGLPVRFDRTALSEQMQELSLSVPDNATHVLVRVSARTLSGAFENAQSSIDLMRGLWNYGLNARVVRRFHSGPPRPVNAILPGGVYTLHEPDGRLIPETFWYDQQTFRDSWTYNPDKHWPHAQAVALRFRARLRAIKYRADLETAFVRYTRALDHSDHDICFHRLWNVLEYLTVPPPGKYDKLISRAAFVAPQKDHRLTCLVLEHLREVRNALIHEGGAHSNMEAYVYQLKRITELVLRFHLRNGMRFNSRGQAAEYLDIPTDLAILKQRVKDYRRVLRQRSQA